MTLDLSYPIVTRLDLAPSKCAICQGTEGEFIDTQKRFPGFPSDNYNVYLCMGCLNQIARHTLNLVPEQELLVAKNEIKGLEMELVQAHKELDAFETIKERVRA